MGTPGWKLLAGLSNQEREEFLGLARPRRFDRGHLVCAQGDPADSVHLVVRGRLGVRVSLPGGAAAMLRVIGPGDYFGELALWSAPARRTAAVEALEPVETLSVAGTAFRALCERRPSLERALVAMLAERVVALSTSLLEALYEPLERRVHRRLLELAHVYGGTDPVRVPITQTQLAEMAGGTRPTVNQVLQGLEVRRIVRLGRGRIDVLDRSRLEVG